MKIAVVFAATYPPEIKWNSYYTILDAFEEMTHQVDRYNLMDTNSRYHFNRLDPLMDRRSSYDLVVVLDLGRIHTDKIHHRHYKCLVIGFMGDDPQSFKENLRCAPQYDILLTPQRYMVDVYRSHGFSRVYWWPYYFDPRVHRKIEGIDKEWDICTVMVEYGRRRKNLDALKASWYRFENGYQLWGEEYSRFLQSGKIVFNQSNHEEITSRVFEALACGCFLITNRIPAHTGFYQLFTPGEDLVLFWNRLDLFRKIRYYLRHPDERERIAENGYRKVIANHSSAHRAKEILQIAERWM